MIILPTRRKLIKKREALYEHLYSILQYAPIQQVEEIMRRIHAINYRLRSYFRREHEPEQIFEDNDKEDTTTL